MKPREMRDMTQEELQVQHDQLMDELVNLRIKLKMRQLDNPLRVHALGPQRSLVVATMIMPPELPQATFDGLVVCLDEELDRLAEVVVGEHAQPV